MFEVKKVVSGGCSDSTGRHCTAEQAEEVQRLLDVFPVLIARYTIPEIAEKLARLKEQWKQG
jgi:hypothetical protein